jgi:hypothetical protein
LNTPKQKISFPYDGNEIICVLYGIVFLCIVTAPSAILVLDLMTLTPVSSVLYNVFSLYSLFALPLILFLFVHCKVYVRTDTVAYVINGHDSTGHCDERKSQICIEGFHGKLRQRNRPIGTECG